MTAFLQASDQKVSEDMKHRQVPWSVAVAADDALKKDAAGGQCWEGSSPPATTAGIAHRLTALRRHASQAKKSFKNSTKGPRGICVVSFDG